MDIEIKNIPPFRVASAPLNNIHPPVAGNECSITAALTRSLSLALGVSQPHGVKGMALYDPKTLAGKQCIPVSQEILHEANLQAHKDALRKNASEATVEFTPSGRYAVTFFKGPYSGLKQATIDAEKEIKKKRLRRAAGPTMELYMNDSSTTPPDELITQICIPLADA